MNVHVLREEHAEWLAAAEQSHASGFCLAQAERIEARIVELEVPAPPKLPSRYESFYRDGVETIALKNWKTRPRLIAGIASTSTINGHNDALLSRGCKIKMPIPVLSQHQGLAAPIGEAVLVRKREREIFVICSILEGNEAADHCWDLIERGETLSFSGAADTEGLRLQGHVDGKRFFDEWRLKEISICRAGANPDCYFEIFRGDDR